MAIQVRVGGTWRTISGLQAYANGAWRNILQVQVYSGGAWRVVANYQPPQAPPAPSISLSISPPSQSINGNSFSQTTQPFTATPSGGVVPFTYRWVISQAGGSERINSPTLASTTLTETGMRPGDFETAELQCTVTDSLNQTASATCGAAFTRNF